MAENLQGQVKTCLTNLIPQDECVKLPIDQMVKEICKISESPEVLKEKLNIYYEYEKNHLEILKNYKEELKFVQSIQEDLRKERSKFFSENLKAVAESLKSTGVDEKVQSIWIQELVASYTQSLNVSEEVVKESTVKTLYEINKKKEQTVNQTQSN